MKTPEQIADEIITERKEASYFNARDSMIAAIESDRAQRDCEEWILRGRTKMKLTVADMKKVVTLEDVLYVLEKHLQSNEEYITVDLGDAGYHDVPVDTIPNAMEIVEKMYEFAEER